MAKAEALPKIGQFKKLCETIWPVEASLPNMEIQKARQEMGKLWPYNTGALWAWYWGISETG